MPTYPTYKLGEIIDKVSVVCKVKQKEYLTDGLYPVIDQGQPLIGGYTDDENLLVKTELPVLVFGDHTKVKKYVDFPFVAGADGTKIIRPKKEYFVEPKLFYWFLHCVKFPDKGYARHFQYLLKSDIAVPPLPIQHQIVTRIETLFAELDKAVQHLRTAQQQLKTYRQAVLRDAFEECKEMKTVLELSTIVTSGSRGWAKYYTDKKDARFVRITDLTRDRIILQSNNIQYISLPPNAEGKRSLLQPNDVLVSITADLGSIALVPQNIGEAYINQHIAMIRFKNTKLGKFMAYYLKSDFGQKELLKNKRGNGKLGLGLDDIRNTYIPMVEEEAASDIVNKIESRLSQAEAAEARIAESLQKTEALRQSILKKAFSGELV